MPDDPTPEESAAAIAHFEYYKELHSKGTLILAGRTQEPPHIGIMIFAARDSKDANNIANSDPAILNGTFACRVQSYQVALLKSQST